MNTPASQVLTAFVLDRVEQEPIARQIELYEAVAEFAATPVEAREYRAVVEDLKRTGRRQRLLRLNFKRRAEG